MKIRPNASELQGKLIDLESKDRLQKKPARGASEEAPGHTKRIDEAQISNLGAALNQQLNPAQILQERKAKIESIKDQIKNGTYNPPLADVAQALAEEISVEILSTGGFGDSDE